MSWPLEDEEALDLDEIQGHILIGFGGAPQALGAYTAADPAAAGRTAGRWSGVVTTARHLLRRKGRRARDVVGRVGSGPWVALALSQRVLEAAGRPADLDDAWFAAPSMAAVGALNDLPARDGGPRGSDWLVGAPDRPVDVLLVVAAGTASAAEEVVGWFTEEAQPWIVGEPFLERLLPIKGSKEHFGFRDGISQPAVLGTYDGGKLFEEERPTDDGGAPRTLKAQDLVWPGEFLFGYRGTAAGDPRSPGREVRPSDDAAAAFARNGSLLVYRRLGQDVHAFRAFCQRKAEAHANELDGLTAAALADLIVGRRREGFPLSARADADARDPAVMNGFDFRHDAMDRACPLGAHIRKVNPREGDKDKRLRRILRRGAPFGSEYDDGELAPAQRGRGLAFLAYMTNTEDQFGLLATHWMNDPDAPAGGSGVDLLVGQAPPPDAPRVFNLRRHPPAVEIQAEADEKWVHTTGGAFLFAPSLSALRSLANVETEGDEAMESGPQPEDLKTALKQYAIYEHPRDYPDGYVVRDWLVTRGGDVLPGDSQRAESLDAARALLPPGATKVSGPDLDDPTIIEVWM